MPPDRLMESKAPKACRHCRLHKRRCDKGLPGCSRCASKLIRCYYDDDAPLETEPDTKLKWDEPLAIQRDSCGLELTPAGEKQLLWAACQSQESHFNQTDPKSLMSLAKDIFTYGGTSVQQVSDTYFATAYTWLPVLDEPNIQFNLQGTTETFEDTFALLLLCMYLLNQTPCHHPNHSSNSALHKTTRRLFSLLEAPTDVFSYTTRLQAGLLLTAYECGHGMTREATSTLGTCFGLIRQLEMIGEENRRGETPASALKLCWAGIISLDRSIVLSCADSTAALLIPAKEILPPYIVSYMDANEGPYGDVVHKLCTRARSALLVGESLRAVDGGPESDCVEAKDLLHDFIRQHAISQEESYPVCEGIAMALSAVVSAYKKRTKRLGSAADVKLDLDIKFAYNITFEMCRIEGSMMRGREKGLQRLCFAGLGCLYRAAVDMDEMCLRGATPEDTRQLRENLEWFSNRWKVADVLLKRLDRNALLRSKRIYPVDMF